MIRTFAPLSCALTAVVALSALTAAAPATAAQAGTRPQLCDGGPAGEGVLTAKVEYLAAE